MPRQLANPVQKPAAAAVALDALETRVTRTEQLAIRSLECQAGVRLYSADGQALERLTVHFGPEELSKEDAAALLAAYETIERLALTAADRKGALPSAEQPAPAAKPSALK